MKTSIRLDRDEKAEKKLIDPIGNNMNNIGICYKFLSYTD